MKRLLSILSAILLCGCFQVQCAFADNPTCILMKFTDDTRFDRVDSIGTLSDLVLEKLIATGKFNFKETKVIDENLEKRLYDERAEEFANAQWAMNSGNYSVLFEGAGFDEKKAQSIATAKIGQFVSPSIISNIGLANKADYLIQGTIINIGTGNWMDEKIANIANYSVTAMSVMGSSGAANFLGPVGMLAGNVSVKKTGVGAQADMRVIKASTGEVVWHKCVTGSDTQKQISLGLIKVGSDKLNNEMYFKAMNATAQLVVDALVGDLDSGKLFLK